MAEKPISELTIYEKMIAITEEAEKIPKNGYNDFSKYHYVKAVDAIGHIRLLLIKHRVHLTIQELELKRYLQGKNFHSETKNVARFINVDNPEDYHEVAFNSVSADTLDKDIFKSKTNGMKFLITQEFKLITDDYIDAEADPKPGAPSGDDNVTKINDEQLITLREICESKGYEPEEKLKSLAERVYDLKDIDALPATEFEDAQNRMNKLPMNEG